MATPTGGLGFFADNAGTVPAARTAGGGHLWSLHLDARVRASPMTYMVRGKQFVTVAVGESDVSFPLPAATAPRGTVAGSARKRTPPVTMARTPSSEAASRPDLSRSGLGSYAARR